MVDLDEVVLGHDELEAIRLKNLLGLSQEEAATQMNISQPTLHRLLSSAYEKVTDAIVNGKALRIEGGNISVCEDALPACGRGRKCGHGSVGRATVQEKGQKKQRGDMIIAITSADGTLEGMVDERFGRSKKIIIYDRAKGSFVVIDNATNMNLPQGAGIQTAQNVAKTDAQVLVSGHIGPNAFHVLQAAGIETYSASNITVKDAIAKLEDGSLKRLANADVKRHWQ